MPVKMIRSIAAFNLLGNTHQTSQKRYNKWWVRTHSNGNMSACFIQVNLPLEPFMAFLFQNQKIDWPNAFFIFMDFQAMPSLRRTRF